MTTATLTSKLSQLPGLRRRRVRIWGLIVLCIVAALLLQAAFPGVHFLPSVGTLSPLVILALFAVALVCEYVDSSLGMGYGTTLTPLLLLVGFEPLEIVPCVLLSEFITGLTAGLMHHRDGNVDLVRDKRVLSTVVLLSLLSTLGALAAVTLALSIPKFWLNLFIAIIILTIGMVILLTIRRKLRYRRGHIVAVGAIAAFNKGLSGGGYGPLVTAGQVVSGLPAKHAVAITSLAESFTCIVGLSAYLLLHRHLDLTLAAPLTLGAILSVPMATLTVRRIPEKAMRTSVGVVTCLLGVFALAKLLF